MVHKVSMALRVIITWLRQYVTATQSKSRMRGLRGAALQVSASSTCGHTQVRATDQTCYLNQSLYSDPWPTSPSADAAVILVIMMMMMMIMMMMTVF